MKCWSRIQGPYLKYHLHLAKKWSESHNFTVEPRRKNCDSPRMMGKNDGYEWIDLGTLSSKMMEVAGKLTGDGWKMAKIVVAPHDHAPPIGRVACRPKLKLQEWGHQKLPFPLVRHMHNDEALAMASSTWSWTKKVMGRERESYRFGQLKLTLSIFWLVPFFNIIKKLLFNSLKNLMAQHSPFLKEISFSKFEIQ